MASLLPRSLQLLRVTKNEILLSSVLYNQHSSLHTSSSTAKGGKRNPEHIRAARMKKQMQKMKNPTVPGGSERRLAKPIPTVDLEKSKQKSHKRRVDISPGTNGKTHQAASRQKSSNGSRASTKGGKKSSSERDGDLLATDYQKVGDFIPGVDDFTAPESSRPSTNSKRSKRRAERPQPTRDTLPHTESSILANNVTEFSSVPLNTGLLESLADNLGHQVTPTEIQRLSLSHFFKRNPRLLDPSPLAQKDPSQSMTLLASQTGSGKSIAYLLPMLHSIKWKELKSMDENPDAPPRPLYAPKGLILAPTHELSRQLSRFAKGLCHHIKLRVLCLSQENKGVKASDADEMDLKHLPLPSTSGEFQLLREDAPELVIGNQQRPIDIVVGTTARVLDLSRGRQWRDELEKLMERNPWEKDGPENAKQLGRLNPPGWNPTMDLSQVDWVVMDEADVVYGSDFVQTTELLLNDIAAAKRGQSSSEVGQGPQTGDSAYPFNLVLTTATIPKSLDHYVSTNYPTMERLTSIELHHLPKSILAEHVPYIGGNRAANIAQRLQAVFSEDSMQYSGSGERSKVLVFCNKSSKVEGLVQYLTEHGIPAISLIRQLDGGKRSKNSDKAIESFLKTPSPSSLPGGNRKSGTKASTQEVDESAPRILVTTSLLSRGLDFSESVRYVFIVDEPQSMVDFIHRAGRTGRAGAKGKVVIFSKSSGRGSERSRTGLRGKIMEHVGIRPHRFARRPSEAFVY
ncbi:RNA helicase [Serendipita sp. 399]|nr:RNA helicase [Serendipita sp. 399]